MCFCNNFFGKRFRIGYNANMFFAKAGNNIQFRFIESTGLKATDFLKRKLGNNLLQFYVVMEENKNLIPKTDAPLTSREQFLKMAEQYPLVKELKERLKLELDYWVSTMLQPGIANYV